MSLIGIQGDEPTPQELLDAIPDATEVIAVTLPTIENLMDIDEASVGEKGYTYQTLVWNYRARWPAAATGICHPWRRAIAPAPFA